NFGDFRGAAQCLLSSNASNLDALSRQINLTCCFERAGDLKAALTHSSTAQELAAANGNVPFYALSLNNSAAIKTKLGEMLEAKQLFNQTYDAIRDYQRAGYHFELLPMAVIECDAAVQNMHLGNYGGAAECLKKASSVSSD